MKAPQNFKNTKNTVIAVWTPTKMILLPSSLATKLKFWLFGPHHMGPTCKLKRISRYLSSIWAYLYKVDQITTHRVDTVPIHGTFFWIEVRCVDLASRGINRIFPWLWLWCVWGMFQLVWSPLLISDKSFQSINFDRTSDNNDYFVANFPSQCSTRVYLPRRHGSGCDAVLQF
jgi:hypothetical protein